ncbi:hypothetical protein RN01_25485 [Cupriavidus sp. SHE]|nr:hypothetical protein RN01_25485 [Cupriavidus sp. SHE]
MKIVQRIFIAFKFDEFEKMRNPRIYCRSLPILPVRRINNLLNTRFCYSVKIFALLNNNIFSMATIFAIETKDGMSRRRRTAEIIQNHF